MSTDPEDRSTLLSSVSLHKNQENEPTVTQRQYLYTITQKGQYMSFCSEDNIQNEVKNTALCSLCEVSLECNIGQIFGRKSHFVAFHTGALRHILE